MLRPIPEAARLLGGIHPQTVRRMIRLGKLRGTRVEGRVMVHDDDIDAYIAANRIDDTAGTPLAARPGGAATR